ncbi:MAG: hypothetical protein APF84_07775 [Gracilibacter sp. BRH_c7a]|nr:MAG: hypothetical protein APF84_07775 [Gracilibacter sp. BRH_c7a]
MGQKAEQLVVGLILMRIRVTGKILVLELIAKKMVVKINYLKNYLTVPTKVNGYFFVRKKKSKNKS